MLFRKKKKEDEEEASEDVPVKEAIKNSSNESSGSLSAEVEKLKTKFDSFSEMRNAFNERFRLISEQVGELRGMNTDANRNIQRIEITSTKTADLVESVKPERLMIELQKMDGKVEALRANIESNETMMNNLMDEVKKVKTQLTAFKGLDEVIKLNDDVKKELMSIKKEKTTIERHSDKIESIFMEMQKAFRQFTTFPEELDSIKASFRQITTQFDDAKVKLATMAPKKDVETMLGKFDTFVKQIDSNVKTMDKKSKDFSTKFITLEKGFKDEFKTEFYKAKVMSEAFERLLKDNPQLVKELNLLKYMKEETDSELNKKQQVEKEEALVSNAPVAEKSSKKGLFGRLLKK